MLAESAGKKGALDTFDNLLKACWLGATALGPYPEGFTWDDVLIGDRFVITVALRIATHGAEYGFKVQCTDKDCRERFWWDVHLENDLPRKAIPRETLDLLSKGLPISTKLRDGRSVDFRILTGKGEREATKSSRFIKDKLFTASLAARVTAIEGVSPADLVAFIDEMDLGDVNDLIQRLDEMDGGIDTALNVQCSECGNVMEMNLPLGREFWLPSRRPSTSTKTTR